VGINEFEHLPGSSWLNGCINDAEDFAAALQDVFRFDSSSVTVLSDRQATKAAVEGALTELVEQAERGDLDHIVFSFSSHGTQVPDPSGDEPDRADEALAAYDIRSIGDAWDTETVIVDDDLNVLLGRVPEGCLVEVYLDTCHSGTGLRAMDLLPGRKPRFLPPPTPAAVDDLGEREPVGLRDLVRAAARSGASAPVLLAACRADQTAADAYFDGRYNGAFSYHLLRALRAPSPGSRREVLNEVRAALRAGRFSQTPQLEGSRSARAAPVGQPG
jgi:hypothetical protein